MPSRLIDALINPIGFQKRGDFSEAESTENGSLTVTASGKKRRRNVKEPEW